MKLGKATGPDSLQVEIFEVFQYYESTVFAVLDPPGLIYGMAATSLLLVM